MTRTTKTNARKPLVAGLALALAVAGALTLGAPRPAMANDGSETYGSYSQQVAGHFEGEKVTIQPEVGGPVFAEWHKLPTGAWSATFWTNNWTRVNAYPSPTGWTFWVNDNGESVQITRTVDEGPGPQGAQSHWQESFGIRRY